jgi:RAT1-interacting protein
MKLNSRGKPSLPFLLLTHLLIHSLTHSNPPRKLLKHYIQSYLLGVPEIIVGFRTPAGVLSTVQRFKTVEIPRTVRDKSSSRGGGGRGMGGGVAWDAGVCLGWGNRFLEFLKGVVGPGANLGEHTSDDKEHGHAKEENVKEDSDSTVWRVTFTPIKGVSIRILDADEAEDVRRCGGGAGVDGELTGEQEPEAEKVDRVGFLPRWFWDEVHDMGAGVGEGGGEREVVSEAPRREEENLKKDIVTKGVVIPPGWQI